MKRCGMHGCKKPSVVEVKVHGIKIALCGDHFVALANPADRPGEDHANE